MASASVQIVLAAFWPGTIDTPLTSNLEVTAVENADVTETTTLRVGALVLAAAALAALLINRRLPI